jgi:hypothetical protein
LQLLHQLDPAGTRELVQQALEAGSKEMKVVAIQCLGADAADLTYLLEQAAAKAQEVRQAAYQALSALEATDALAVLQKAMAGPDLDLAADALRRSTNPRLVQSLIVQTNQELTELTKTKDKKEAGKKIGRVQTLLRCVGGRQDKESEAFLQRVFEQRGDLAKVKGDTISGIDLVSILVRVMEHGTPTLRSLLAETHASLRGEDLDAAFRAARHSWPADRVFQEFAPYLTAKVDHKKKQRDPAWV